MIATAAGARRTDSTVARWRAATQAMDVWVGRGGIWGVEADFDRIEQLPQVIGRPRRSVDLTYWARTDEGRPVAVTETEMNVGVGSADPSARRPKVLAGRAPDPDRADEVWVDDRAADHHHLRVGSTLRVRLATKREAARIAATGEHDPRADPETTGTGPLLTLRVVGIRADLQSDDAFMLIAPSPALYQRYRGQVGEWFEFTGIRLRRGDADLDAFRAGVERIAAGEPVEIYPKLNLVAKLQSSIHLQAQALWVLAALAGVTALLLIAQALSRQTALESGDHPLLRSLGMTRTQLFVLGVARVVPVAVVAGVIAVGVAIALSPLAPLGVAREAEPDPGFALDVLPLALGAAATAIVVVLAACIPAWRAARSAEGQGTPPPSRLAGLLARTGLSPSRTAGVRMALEPGRGRSAIPVGSTLVAAVAGVAAVATAFVITASMDHLLSTPRLYGQNWDAVIGNDAEARNPRRLEAELRADRSIAQLSGGTVAEARVAGVPTAVVAMDAIRGSLSPTLLEGRAPAGPLEIVLGSKSADAIGARVGDRVKARIGKRASSFRVVGRGVLPELGIAGLAPLGLGRGVAMTFQGLRRLDPGEQPNILLLGLAAGADREATLARLERDVFAAAPERPADVGNWGRVSGLPHLLAALVAVAAAAMLAHALVTSIRRRRRDLAIFKTLGFERRDLRSTVAWQATTVGAVGLLAGLPLGVGLGRFAWNLLATGLGVAPEAVAPLWPGLLVIPATLLLANLVALLPGRAAARTQPAAVLRAE